MILLAVLLVAVIAAVALGSGPLIVAFLSDLTLIVIKMCLWGIAGIVLVVLMCIAIVLLFDRIFG